MKRTQIYLSEAEDEVLERLASDRRTSRSQLIREAIRAVYLEKPDKQQLLDAIRESAGCWRGDRPSGEEWVGQRRTGRLARFHSGS